jgi:tetratricopeptide (TPR) repeat protein
MALDAKDMTKAEEILKAWDYADANDSELYVSYFNFYTVKSMDAGATTGYDEKYARKALEFITEGIDRFPTRFDMRIAKIYMLGELKDYSAYTSEVIKMIDYSDKIKNGWKGENFSLVEKPDKMFEEAVLDSQDLLFSKAKDDSSLYKYMIQISEEMLKYYPKNVQSLLTMSTVYITQKEYDKSLEALLKAKDIDSVNSVLLYNIAYVYNLKGDKENAKKYYELTIKHIKEKEEKLKEAAQKQLEALK